MSKNMINEERLFTLLPYFFENPSGVLVELAQNASRSGASKLDIALKNGVLTASDNGRGAGDCKSLLVLADSAWSDEVEAQQNPAGWGIFFLISISKKITFSSLFGEIEIECERFLKDRKYRESALGLVDRKKSSAGFYVEAVLKPEISENSIVSQYFCSHPDILRFFPMDITVNGQVIEKGKIDEKINECELKLEYKGNKVGVSLNDPYNLEYSLISMSDFASRIRTVWYGIDIKPSNSTVILNVTQASPVTPVLPYRNSIQEDEKLQEFYEFIKKEVLKYCISYVSNGKNTDENSLKQKFKILKAIASQEELDSLDRFYVINSEPYHPEDHYNSNSFTVVVRKGEKIISEDIRLFINGKKEDCSDDIFLPEGIITSVEAPERKPNWLEVKKKTYKINIRHSPKKKYKGYFHWSKAKITCEKEAVNVVGIVQGDGEGEIFYADTAHDSDDIMNSVFENKIYYEDGDSADSQRYYFDEELKKDIQNVVKEYHLYDLLNGFCGAGLKIDSIKSILIRKNRIEVMIGKKKRIFKLAA